VINWQYFPKSDNAPDHLVAVVSVFQKHEPKIKSPENKLNSDDVLTVLRKDLVTLGFDVEKGKIAGDKIRVPVLFGKQGKADKSFDADAFNKTTGAVLEVEAGRGVTNYQFLKDLFQACMMHKVDYLAIAVRNKYRSNADFDKVTMFFDTLYASGRLKLPLKGVLIIGY
jgi:hypothetical protein